MWVWLEWVFMVVGAASITVTVMTVLWAASFGVREWLEARRRARSGHKQVFTAQREGRRWLEAVDDDDRP